MERKQIVVTDNRSNKFSG